MVNDSRSTDDYSPRKLFSGTCKGGPLNGQQGESRFPDGFILVDKPNGLVWTYEYITNSECGNYFTCINDTGTAEAADKDAINFVANNNTFDVRAYDAAGSVH